jgi:hypothetical protein
LNRRRWRWNGYPRATRYILPTRRILPPVGGPLGLPWIRRLRAAHRFLGREGRGVKKILGPVWVRPGFGASLWASLGQSGASLGQTRFRGPVWGQSGSGPVWVRPQGQSGSDQGQSGSDQVSGFLGPVAPVRAGPGRTRFQAFSGPVPPAGVSGRFGPVHPPAGLER